MMSKREENIKTLVVFPMSESNHIHLHLVQIRLKSTIHIDQQRASSLLNRQLHAFFLNLLLPQPARFLHSQQGSSMASKVLP